MNNENSKLKKKLGGRFITGYSQGISNKEPDVRGRTFRRGLTVGIP